MRSRIEALLIKQEGYSSGLLVNLPALRYLDDLNLDNEKEVGFTMDVAVVSMQGVFPEATSVETLWENLKKGIVSIPEHSPTVQDISAGELWIHRRPLISNPEYFDAGFFRLSEIEAEALDPQIRILLEQCWLALEQANACHEDARLRTGIFAGLRHSRYLDEHLQHSRRHQQSLGGDYLQMINRKDSAATFLAYQLGLGGPAISLNTACSTSLLAVHLACNSLLTWECDVALAGSAAIPAFEPESQKAIPGGFLSPDGLCRPFSHAANGTIDGSGVAVVALKRLEDAIRDGSKIHGVIRGSAINNDGNDKVGYSAPSVSGQTRVINDALDVAEVDVEDIGYIETHGTGTALGDSIEIRALVQSWEGRTDKKAFCALGSIKANVGHLGTAAGVTGLIKACCVVRDGVIPPLAHCDTPNPAFDLEQTPFRIPQKTEHWQHNSNSRMAAVSSFGIGGTNVHLVVEQPPLKPDLQDAPLRANSQSSLLMLSAKTPGALVNQCRQLSGYLSKAKDADLPGISATLAHTRLHFPFRFSVCAQNIHQAQQRLGQCSSPKVSHAESRILFTFPGQGVQHLNMTLSLYRENAIYRQYLDIAADSMRKHGGGELLNLLSHDEETLKRTEYAQPAIFATSWALAKWWEQMGVRPDVMVGHSIGEWVAACLAGVFELDDAMRLVCMRGKLMQEATPGQMLSVFMSAIELREHLPHGVEIAVINQPENCVVGGERQQLESLTETLSSLNIAFSYLHTSHAFHTSSMSEAAQKFESAVNLVHKRSPSISIISNVTGKPLTAEQATSGTYWADQIKSTVQFSDGMGFALAEGANVVVECGPGNVLTTLTQGRQENATFISSQPHISQPGSSYSALIAAAGEAWACGLDIDWKSLAPNEIDLDKFGLPGYSFDRKYYWVERNIDTTRFNADAIVELITSNSISLLKNGEEYSSSKDIQTLIQNLTSTVNEENGKGLLKDGKMDLQQDNPANDQADIQQKITQIWQEVLAVPSINPDESFFDLGGNSLWALQIVSKVNAEFGCEVQLTELLSAATINDLTHLVETKLISGLDDSELNALLANMHDLSESEINALLLEVEGKEHE
ncbi:type I polyketide synthase [Hahella sp. CCB-MM4]|uniref:type I polyketide synthase n=1 Tax=Hahella sp. (strain CCB-MM4) TaxID=1926491 RepID=UPI0011408622|nr:type I polyketide synthase [Hahella sp. CCB-MM4]